MTADPTAASALGSTAAKALLDTGAVLFRPNQPFFFSSGWASPVYVDCRRAMSFPLARDALIELSIQRVQSVVGYAALEGIAGAEGRGLPFASIIADRLHLPLVVARRQPAGLGPGAQTDGVVEPGRRLLLVDDVTTDGRTKSMMSQALRRAGATVHHAFVLFRYGIFDAVVHDEDLDIALFSLLTWRELLEVARREQAFSEQVLARIDEYIEDPLIWSSKNGGLAAADFEH